MYEMIAFTRGVPAQESFPLERLADCAAYVLRHEGQRLLQYGKAEGYAPLKEWIAHRFRFPADQVLIGQGSLQLLDNLTRMLLKPGDLVFVEQPSYDRSLTIFRRAGARLAGMPLVTGSADLAVLESSSRSGQVPRLVYVIPDFQNPSGGVMSLKTRRALLDLAQEFKFWLVEDNPYHDLRYRGEDLPKLVELAQKQVIHMSSFSKLISPGLRVGFMLLPPELTQAAMRFAEDTYINASYLNQAIVYDFIRRGWLDENLVELKELYRPRLDAILEALQEHFTANADWVRPEGGFFVGLNLTSGYQLPTYEEIRQAGLALSDSHAFFLEGGSHFVRLPFCALTPDEIREGIRRLRNLFTL